jgi:hypothetical protein
MPAPEPSPEFHCEIMDLTNEKCRWVVSTGYPAVFCGTPGCDVGRGVPYCGAHCRLAYDRRRDRGPSPTPQPPLATNM